MLEVGLVLVIIGVIGMWAGSATGAIMLCVGLTLVHPLLVVVTVFYLLAIDR